MTLLWRCDNDMCGRTAEPHFNGMGRVGSPKLPISDNWTSGPYGDFCCEQCADEVIQEEQRREDERRARRVHS